MLSFLKIERKKCGVNILLITSAVLIAFSVLCVTGGNLVNLPLLGFEIICPFLIALLVSEWVQTLSDPMIDIVIVHSKSLFAWVVGKFLVVTGISGVLCVACMLGLRLWVLDFSITQTLFIFVATTLFFSSIGVFSSFLSKQSHVSAAVCGIIWLLSLMANSLVRIPLIAHIYPYIKFVENDTDIWVANKIILLSIAICLWVRVYFICKNRRLIS